MRGTFLAVGVILLLAWAPWPQLQPPPTAQGAPDETQRGLVGAHVHSRWLAPASPLSREQLLGLVEASGLEVVGFGAPLLGPEARAASPATVGAWLAAVAPRPALPQLNTFALPGPLQGEHGILALFEHHAAALEGHANALAAVGGNEPLTRGRGWASAADAEQRVRMEYRLWHEVSGLPFCHKFTNPSVNAAGAGWAMMEGLWRDSQDAICYDWYPSNRDTLATLDRLRALGRALGKPVYVLESEVPGDDPAVMAQLAARADAVVLFQLLGTPGGEYPHLAAWTLQPDGKVQPRAPLAVLPAGRPG